MGVTAVKDVFDGGSWTLKNWSWISFVFTKRLFPLVFLGRELGNYILAHFSCGEC